MQEVKGTKVLVINDGKLLYCPCSSKPWKHHLEKLYAEFYAENSQEPPKEITPFDNERLVRILATNDKPIADKDFIAYGMIALMLCNHETGARYVGHMNDVFVSQSFQHQDIEESLMRALIEEAKKRDLISLQLASNPRRTAIHHLYKKVGFRLVAKATGDSGNRGTDLFHLPLRTI